MSRSIRVWGVLVAVLVLLTWFSQAGYSFYRQIDTVLFNALNGTLSEGKSLWAAYWAFANTRYFDLTSAVVMLAVLLHLKRFPRFSHRLGPLVYFILLLAGLLVIRVIVHWLVSFSDHSIQSPSVVLDSAIRLHQLYPDWPTKDQSYVSFPGDHAAVSMLWFFLVMFEGRRGVRWVAVILLCFVIPPRLVAGAHWLSDDVIGGGSIVAFTLLLCYRTAWLDGLFKNLRR